MSQLKIIDSLVEITLNVTLKSLINSICHNITNTQDLHFRFLPTLSYRSAYNFGHASVVIIGGGGREIWDLAILGRLDLRLGRSETRKTRKTQNAEF